MIERVLSIYCEHGADPRKVKSRIQSLPVKLVHFPYDSASRSGVIPIRPTPSAAQIQDLNFPINELPGTLSDYSPSPEFAKILMIVGGQNRRDALHIDSAFKSRCVAFVTKDCDILDHVKQLEALLGIRFFDSSEAGLNMLMRLIEDRLKVPAQV
jgi:hypothetical protein